MTDPELMFKVEQIGVSTKITNNSNYDLWISMEPVKPQRKRIDICIIPPGQFRVYKQPIHINRLSFRLLNTEVSSERSNIC